MELTRQSFSEITADPVVTAPPAANVPSSLSIPDSPLRGPRLTFADIMADPDAAPLPTAANRDALSTGPYQLTTPHQLATPYRRPRYVDTRPHLRPSAWQAVTWLAFATGSAYVAQLAVGRSARQTFFGPGLEMSARVCAVLMAAVDATTSVAALTVALRRLRPGYMLNVAIHTGAFYGVHRIYEAARVLHPRIILLTGLVHLPMASLTGVAFFVALNRDKPGNATRTPSPRVTRAEPSGDRTAPHECSIPIPSSEGCSQPGPGDGPSLVSAPPQTALLETELSEV